MCRLIVFGYTLLIMAIFFAAPGANAGEIHRISNPDQLQAALKQAKPGTIIELEGGDYGALRLKSWKAPKHKPLVLRSADRANPARFLKMGLRNVQGLTLDGVVFDYRFTADDPIHLRPFQILSSTHITIQNALFDGDLAKGRASVGNGFPTAFGLGVTSSSHVVLENSEIRDFYRGLVFSQSSDLTIRKNNLHKIRMDGMNFAEVKNVLIAQNHIHDFSRALDSKDHADMIQFWTNKTKTPSVNVTVRDNLLNSGQGWYTQSIFMRNDMVDRGIAGYEMFYRNFVIENNLIINAHLHGITIGATDGLKINNNTVVRNALSEGKKKNPALWRPQIRVAKNSRNVELLRNVTSKITGPENQPDWTVRDNFFVQDSSRGKAGFYGDVFSTEVLRDPRKAKSFRAKPGGPLDGSGLGARIVIR